YRRAADVPAQPFELLAFIGPGRHAGVQAGPGYLANPVTERITTGRQSLPSEHLSPRLGTDSDTVSDRVPQQGCHRVVIHRIRGQIAVFDIPFQQALPFQIATHPVGDGVRQLGELWAGRRLDPAETR